jgi:hypothetical protein
MLKRKRDYAKKNYKNVKSIPLKYGLKLHKNPSKSCNMINSNNGI